MKPRGEGPDPGNGVLESKWAGGSEALSSGALNLGSRAAVSRETGNCGPSLC